MSKSSLLLVDNDARSLRVLEVSLKKAGFVVTTAENGRDALDKLKAGHPDLVVSDTDMPEMDGFELCRTLRADPETSDIPIVFLTGQTAIEHKIKGLELGVDEYLTKPIYIKEILTRLRILLQKTERTKLEGKRDPNTRFAGTLTDMGVVDLIQTIEVSRKSGLIHLKGLGTRRGTIYFREGKVIDADCGQLQADDAVYRLLTWSEGEFELLFRTVRHKAKIETSTQGLLMEGMRRLDEWGRLNEQLPPLERRFLVDVEELADRLADLPDELNATLRLFDGGRTLMDVIDIAPEGDLECLERISKLYFEGVLLEASEPAVHREQSSPVLAQAALRARAQLQEVAEASARSRNERSRGEDSGNVLLEARDTDRMEDPDLLAGSDDAPDAPGAPDAGDPSVPEPEGASGKDVARADAASAEAADDSGSDAASAEAADDSGSDLASAEAADDSGSDVASTDVASAEAAGNSESDAGDSSEPEGASGADSALANAGAKPAPDKTSSEVTPTETDESVDPVSAAIASAELVPADDIAEPAKPQQGTAGETQRIGRINTKPRKVVSIEERNLDTASDDDGAVPSLTESSSAEKSDGVPTDPMEIPDGIDSGHSEDDEPEIQVREANFEEPTPLPVPLPYAVDTPGHRIISSHGAEVASVSGEVSSPEKSRDSTTARDIVVIAPRSDKNKPGAGRSDLKSVEDKAASAKGEKSSSKKSSSAKAPNKKSSSKKSSSKKPSSTKTSSKKSSSTKASTHTSPSKKAGTKKAKRVDGAHEDKHQAAPLPPPPPAGLSAAKASPAKEPIKVATGEGEPSFARSLVFAIGGAIFVGAAVGLLFWWLSGGSGTQRISVRPEGPNRTVLKPGEVFAPLATDGGDRAASGDAGHNGAANLSPADASAEKNGDPVPTADASPKPPVDAPPPKPKETYKELFAEAKRATRQGKRQEALELVERALARSETAPALTLKADLLLAGGQKGRALAAAETAVLVGPSYSAGWYFRGKIYRSMGNSAKARQSFEKYLELSPNGRKADEVTGILDNL